MERGVPRVVDVRLYQEILDAHPDLVFVVDGELRVLLINQTLLNSLARLGLEESPVGRIMGEALPFLPARVEREVMRVFDTGEPLRSEVATEVQGCEMVMESVRLPLLDDAGQVWAVASLAHDVSPRAAREAAVRAERDRLQMIFDEAPCSLVVLDPEANIEACNRSAWEGARGAGPEALLGRNALEFVEEEDRPLVLKGMVDLAAGGRIHGDSVRYRWDDGALQPGFFAAARLPTPSGEEPAEDRERRPSADAAPRGGRGGGYVVMTASLPGEAPDPPGGGATGAVLDGVGGDDGGEGAGAV